MILIALSNVLDPAMPEVLGPLLHFPILCSNQSSYFFEQGVCHLHTSEA